MGRVLLAPILYLLQFCLAENIEDLLLKYKIENLIDKQTPGAYIHYDAFEEFVRDTFITQEDEEQFLDFRLSGDLSFIRFIVNVVIESDNEYCRYLLFTSIAGQC